MNHTLNPKHTCSIYMKVRQSFPQEDLTPTEPREPPGAEHAADCIATRFVDDAVLSALSIVNMDLQQDYRQAVLLGCGMDTRPFRYRFAS